MADGAASVEDSLLENGPQREDLWRGVFVLDVEDAVRVGEGAALARQQEGAAVAAVACVVFVQQSESICRAAARQHEHAGVATARATAQIGGCGRGRRSPIGNGTASTSRPSAPQLAVIVHEQPVAPPGTWPPTWRHWRR